MIISASRRTDIPAFFSDWFFQRLRERYVLVRNPMNMHQLSRIDLSPDVIDCIVFWTKNPLPMLSRLHLLQPYPYYFQFTLTSYGTDVEPNVPAKSAVLIDTFRRLSSEIGPHRVIWRYDPIFISPRYSFQYHLTYFEKLARALQGAADICTISFLDEYTSIQHSLHSLGAQSPNPEILLDFAGQLCQIAAAYGFQMNACAESLDLRSVNIQPASCIDANFISRLIHVPLCAGKDRNQRPACGCVESIDIGAYNTCQHSCKYCYANHSPSLRSKNLAAYNPVSPLLCGTPGEQDHIIPRPMKSLKTLQISLLE